MSYLIEHLYIINDLLDYDYAVVINYSDLHEAKEFDKLDKETQENFIKLSPSTDGLEWIAIKIEQEIIEDFFFQDISPLIRYKWLLRYLKHKNLLYNTYDDILASIEIKIVKFPSYQERVDGVQSFTEFRSLF